MPVKTITCLAASKKNNGFCYAGKDEAGHWIRPVSDDDGHAISAYWRAVGRGDPAVVGDVLRMSIGQSVPRDWQTENVEHVEEHWRRLRKASYPNILALVDDPDALWPGGRSTNHGVDDELTEDQACAFDHSLLLIRVDDLVVACTDEGYDEVKLKTRAFFTFKGHRYGFVVTDTNFRPEAIGEDAIGEAVLCCSLAEAYEWSNGTRHVSKLVAAIITPETLV